MLPEKSAWHTSPVSLLLSLALFVPRTFLCEWKRSRSYEKSMVVPEAKTMGVPLDLSSLALRIISFEKSS